ncbi:MAG: hypothetical protein IIA33_07555 [Planctomycetes bacterium]|nr:hypothetical protein [Planctomycetota bacterium]
MPAVEVVVRQVFDHVCQVHVAVSENFIPHTVATASQVGFLDTGDELVEKIAGTRWHKLTGVGRYNRDRAAVEAMLRDGTSYIAYNYYVEADGLGISGQPKGKLHANGPVQFFFEGGKYNDFVSSATGFEYKNGATPDNTSMYSGGITSAREPTNWQPLRIMPRSSMAPS